MIGRVWPCHVAKIAGGTGRVRVFLITSPVMLGNVLVAFNTQALLSSAWLLEAARTAAAAAMAIVIRIGPPTFRDSIPCVRSLSEPQSNAIGDTLHVTNRCTRNTRSLPMIRAIGSSLRIFPAFGYFYSIKFPGKIILDRGDRCFRSAARACSFCQPQVSSAA